MKKTKRDYQQKFKDSVFKALDKGITRQLVVVCTGGGKTFTAVDTIGCFPKCLWLTHSEELAEQSAIALLGELELMSQKDLIQTIDRCGGLIELLRNAKGDFFTDPQVRLISDNIGMIKADLFDPYKPIVVASAQTLYKKLDLLPSDMFDAIVVDEAHLFVSETFIKPLKHFKPKLLLNLTATPYRLDGRSLADIADEIVFQYNIEDAINNGYLCEFDAIQIKTNINLDNIKTLGGELNQKELEQVVNTPARNQLILDSYLKYAPGKQNIIFCVDVQHCKDLHEIFIKAGQRAEILVSDKNITPDRKGVVNRFKSGETTHLINVTIATTGFDSPSIQCITDAAPTKSKSRAFQKWGRGTRTLPGVIDGLNTSEERIKAIKASAKPHCVLLDITDTTSRHKIVNTWSLDRDVPIEKRLFTTKEKKDKLLAFQQERRFQANRNVDTKINLFKLPKVELSTSLKMKDEATEAQLGYLAKLGYDTKDKSFTKGDANRLISNAPATDAQIKFLKWKKYDVSGGVTVGEASLAFTELKKREEIQKIKQQTSNNFPISDLL